MIPDCPTLSVLGLSRVTFPVKVNIKLELASKSNVTFPVALAVLVFPTTPPPKDVFKASVIDIAGVVPNAEFLRLLLLHHQSLELVLHHP